MFSKHGLLAARAALVFMVFGLTPAAFARDIPVVEIRLSETEAQRLSISRQGGDRSPQHAVQPSQTVSRKDSSKVASEEVNEEKPETSRSFWSWLFKDPVDELCKGPGCDGAETTDEEDLVAAPVRGERDRFGRKIRHTTYDDLFRKHAKHFFSVAVDWRWFKAQALVESELVPHAKSRSGAIGLMQIMPKTFREVRREIGDVHNPKDPNHSIAAGIYYNRKLYDAWASVPDEDQRLKFMFASYNAGLGTVKKAFVRSGRPTDFKTVQMVLPREPRHYVTKIDRTMDLLQQN